MFVRPAEEINKLYNKSASFVNEFIGDNLNSKLASIKTPSVDIKAIIEIDNSIAFSLNINGYKIEYNVSGNTLNGHFTPLVDKRLELELVIYKNLIEVC